MFVTCALTLVLFSRFILPKDLSTHGFNKEMTLTSVSPAQIDIFLSLLLSFRLQTCIPNFIIDVSTWCYHKHFTCNKFKVKFISGLWLVHMVSLWQLERDVVPGQIQGWGIEGQDSRLCSFTCTRCSWTVHTLHTMPGEATLSAPVPSSISPFPPIIENQKHYSLCPPNQKLGHYP